MKGAGILTGFFIVIPVTAGIDFTARDLQQSLKAKGLPWELAKSFDGSAPVGSLLPVSDYDIGSLSFSLKVNGENRQAGNTYNK